MPFQLNECEFKLKQSQCPPINVCNWKMPILDPWLGNLKGYYCLDGTSNGNTSLPGVVMLLLPLISVDR